jgi:hypothetical protein
MSISMIRGYANPPNEGGVAYQQYSQYGYTYITQEGEGHSEPDDGSFEPIPRMDAYRGPRLATPGPLGSCNCAPSMPMGQYGSGALLPPRETGMGVGMLVGLVAVLWFATK